MAEGGTAAAAAKAEGGSGAGAKVEDSASATTAASPSKGAKGSKGAKPGKGKGSKGVKAAAAKPEALDIPAGGGAGGMDGMAAPATPTKTVLPPRIFPFILFFCFLNFFFKRVFGRTFQSIFTPIPAGAPLPLQVLPKLPREALPGETSHPNEEDVRDAPRRPVSPHLAPLYAAR